MKTRIGIFLLSTTLIFSVNAKQGNVCHQIDLNNLEKLQALYREIDEEEISEVKRRAETIYTMTDDRGRKYNSFYKQCLEPITKESSLIQLDNKKLKTLFELVNTAQFYSDNSQAARKLKLIYDHLKSESDNESRAEDLAAAFVRSRLFEELKALNLTRPNSKQIVLPELQGFDKNTERSLLKLSSDGKYLSKIPFQFPKGSYIVVVSHPNCHFSGNARKWIMQNDEYMELFEDNSTWLTPADGNLYIGQFIETNQNSKMPYYYSNSKSEWPEIDYWGTPAFYFYKDGKLQRKFVGWPQEGREKVLRESLKLIGLL